jgi:hypothetical protein
MTGGHVYDHEAAAAEIPGARIGHRQRKPDRDRRVDCVAAAIENCNADARGALLLRHHHAVVGEDALRGRNDRRACARRDLSGGADEKREYE